MDEEKIERKFQNIKSIPIYRLDETFKFCFTYSVQPKQRIEYKNNKGIMTKRVFNTLPFGIQKHFLTKDINKLNNVAYYFEQHKDSRFHLHGFCIDTARNVLHYMKDRFEDNRMTHKIDYQDHLFLCEIVDYAPCWVAYCLKHQDKKDVFIGHIEDYINSQLDAGIVKIEVNENPKDYTIHSSTDRQFENYLFGGKKFLIEL